MGCPHRLSIFLTHPRWATRLGRVAHSNFYHCLVHQLTRFFVLPWTRPVILQEKIHNPYHQQNIPYLAQLIELCISPMDLFNAIAPFCFLHETSLHSKWKTKHAYHWPIKWAPFFTHRSMLFSWLKMDNQVSRKYLNSLLYPRPQINGKNKFVHFYKHILNDSPRVS